MNVSCLVSTNCVRKLLVYPKTTIIFPMQSFLQFRYKLYLKNHPWSNGWKLWWFLVTLKTIKVKEVGTNSELLYSNKRCKKTILLKLVCGDISNHQRRRRRKVIRRNLVKNDTVNKDNLKYVKKPSFYINNRFFLCGITVCYVVKDNIHQVFFNTFILFVLSTSSSLFFQVLHIIVISKMFF